MFRYLSCRMCNAVWASPAGRAYATPAVVVGGAVFTANVVNGVRDYRHPANGLRHGAALHEPADVHEPVRALLFYFPPATVALAVSSGKALVCGAAWPLTLWQAHYLYGRDGHINSIVYPLYSNTRMYKEEQEKLEAACEKWV